MSSHPSQALTVHAHALGQVHEGLLTGALRKECLGYEVSGLPSAPQRCPLTGEKCGHGLLDLVMGELIEPRAKQTLVGDAGLDSRVERKQSIMFLRPDSRVFEEHVLEQVWLYPRHEAFSGVISNR